MTSEAFSQPSRLLQLPRELRDEICAYAVVEEEEIELDEHNCSEPGLLKTCRQIREEASPLFLSENTFRVEHVDNKFRPQPDHWVWFERTYITVHTSGHLVWDNMKEWLRCYHEDRVTRLEKLGRDAPYELVIFSAAFDVVDEMKDANWEVAERVLDAFRKGIDAKKGDWEYQ